MKSRSSRRSLFAAVAVVAAVAAVAAGAAIAAAPAKKVERAAWQACMAQHGVDFASGNLPTLETARVALDACGLPWKKKVQTFVSCMRAHNGLAALTTALSGLGADRLEKAAKQCGLDRDRARFSLQQRAERLAACMRDEGVAVPTATTPLRQALDGLLHTDRQTLNDAWKACSSELRLPAVPQGS